MSQRLVLRLTDYSQTVDSYEEFFRSARSMGVVGKAKVQYAVDSGGHPIAYIELPAWAPVAVQKPPQRTKRQQATRDRTEARRREVAAEKPAAAPAKRPGLRRKKK